MPIVAPHLKLMAELDCLDLCIYNLETLAPLLPMFSGRNNSKLNLDFNSFLPLLIRRAKVLLPHANLLVPYAAELIPFANDLLDEKNWKLLEPHLGNVLEIYPLIRNYLSEIMANLPDLLAKFHIFSANLLDLAQHADKLCPHIKKLCQVRWENCHLLLLLFLLLFFSFLAQRSDYERVGLFAASSGSSVGGN